MALSVSPSAPRVGAVDVDVGLEAALLLIGIDVLQHVGLLQRLRSAAAPICRVRRCRRTAAYIDRSRCSAARRCAGPRPRPGTAARPATCASLPRSRLTTPSAVTLRSVEGLQRDVDEAGIDLPAAGDADHASSTAGSSWTIVLQLRELLLHRLERDALVALDRADHQAGVLHRKQAVARFAEQVDVEPDRRDKHRQRRRPGMAQRDVERHAVETPASPSKPRSVTMVEPAVRWSPGSRQDQRAHHRRRRSAKRPSRSAPPSTA